MRSCGILMPVFSLPQLYGIGTFGKEAYRFVDFLKEAGQTYWQILPLSPTGYGDSPYQSFSAYAGNPYFIDLELLSREGWLRPEDYTKIEWGDPERIDYSLLYQKRFAVLRKAYSAFLPGADYAAFCRQNAAWLEDYALFMALKDSFDGKPWYQWEEELKRRESKALAEARSLYEQDIGFYCFLQFCFQKQWQALKDYANQSGIHMIGDIPIYVAYDSADVWSHPEQFALDESLTPVEVAGCPPDSFSKEGQLWGNPLYDWTKMKNEVPAYGWWSRRIAYTAKLYDVIRIDHFRGFESYYAIPFADKNAVNGIWRKGPGAAFFTEMEKQLGKLPIVAEDLGFLTQEVLSMLKETGFPGMKVLQFAFDSRADSDYLPHNCDKNAVIYTGTHDNDTIVGWEKTLSAADRAFAWEYLGVPDLQPLNWPMIRAAYASVCEMAIIPMQDFIGLDEQARINTPATLGQNWQWRIKGECINDWLAKILREMATTYRRIPGLFEPETGDPKTKNSNFTKKTPVE